MADKNDITLAFAGELGGQGAYDVKSDQNKGRDLSAAQKATLSELIAQAEELTRDIEDYLGKD